MYEVSYSPEKHIVTIRIKGRVNFQLAKEYSTEAVALARENNCSKFLMDHSGTEIQGGVKRFHLDGSELQEFGFINSDKIAVIIPDLGRESDLSISENQNSRWCQLKYFYPKQKKEVSEWLSD